jgi:hypothetical protein
MLDRKHHVIDAVLVPYDPDVAKDEPFSMPDRSIRVDAAKS